MNPLESIKERFQKLVPMTNKDWLYFSSKLNFIEFDKNEAITHFGQVENRLYYLYEGIVRHIANNVNESISDFTFPNNFFSSYSSFVTRKPSAYELKPVTKTVKCLYLTYSDLQLVYENTNCGQKIGRIAAEQQFLRKSAREVSLLTLNQTEKYLQLLNEQPQYIKAIPLKYLASYLGMTPETLSRVRASIS